MLYGEMCGVYYCERVLRGERGAYTTCFDRICIMFGYVAMFMVAVLTDVQLYCAGCIHCLCTLITLSSKPDV